MKSERGSATIISLTLIIMLVALVMANSLTLSHLSRELKRIDSQQQKKFAATH